MKNHEFFFWKLSKIVDVGYLARKLTFPKLTCNYESMAIRKAIGKLSCVSRHMHQRIEGTHSWKASWRKQKTPYITLGTIQTHDLGACIGFFVVVVIPSYVSVKPIGMNLMAQHIFNKFYAIELFYSAHTVIRSIFSYFILRICCGKMVQYSIYQVLSVASNVFQFFSLQTQCI